MERLEAALEKARKNREMVQAPVQIATASIAADTSVAERWSQLKEIKISARTARNNRISTLVKGANSGSYDLLRSRILRMMRENDWRTMAITSPNKTCGKTTICANIAISLARQPDLRIVALDFDMRRPSLHNVLGYRPSKSLHEIIERDRPVADGLVRVGENLAFGLNNRPAAAPAELLQSKLTRAKIEQIQEMFQPDIVIFDMPPMLVSDDHVGFLPTIDCGLLVGAADSTTITQLDNCEKELAELTSVMGVVLNKCRYTDADNGYEYGYY